MKHLVIFETNETSMVMYVKHQGNYFEFTSKHRKEREHEHDSQFEDYGDVNQPDRTKHTNNKLSKLTKRQKLKELDLNEVGMDYGATPLYTSVMQDEKSVYPKIESCFLFRLHMKDVKTSMCGLYQSPDSTLTGTILTHINVQGITKNLTHPFLPSRNGRSWTKHN